ncbi:MAG TPA: hypothetical protein VFA98_15380 [Thermoanaerobaculia bacterium]|nr:hypothetical protein [Thermoanaerobaculia bacterium]
MKRQTKALLRRLRADRFKFFERLGAQYNRVLARMDHPAAIQ